MNYNPNDETHEEKPIERTSGPEKKGPKAKAKQNAVSAIAYIDP